MIGQTISHYRILSELGKGAMSVVYLAEDKRLKRRVAIKMLDAEHLARTSQNHSRLLREARAISQINHPNIATIYDYGETRDGQPFIVMEYIEGKTLSDILKSRKLLPVSRSVEIIAAVAAALSEAHSKGIIHRDIKPSNIIINKREEVKVLDFGLAKQIEGFTQIDVTDSVQAYAETQTREGVVVGTPLYLSPEQALGAPIDQRSDIFSLGSVFYECLTGQAPFQAPSVIEICARILRDEPILPSKLNANIPLILDGVILKALAKDPKQRYQTVKDLRRSLGFSDLKNTAEHLYFSQENLRQDTEEQLATTSAAKAATKGNTPVNTGENSVSSGSSFIEKLSLLMLNGINPFSKMSLIFLVFLLTCVLSYLGYGILSPKDVARPELILQQQKIVLSGDVVEAVVSFDGKYVASVVREAEGQSISITERSSSSGMKIVKPSKKGYSGLAFQPNGDYIYYLEKEAETATLHRVKKFGDGNQKLLENVNTPVDFSPDGSRIAFIRYDMKNQEAVLMTADIDGRNEAYLTRSPAGENFSLMPNGAGPIWSPDGKSILCPIEKWSKGSFQTSFASFNINTGSLNKLAIEPLEEVSRIAWLRDGSAFIVAGRKSSLSSMQIVMFEYPSGVMKKITNTPDNYYQISITKSDEIFTLRSSINSSIWLTPADQFNQSKKYADGHDQGFQDLAFLSNDELLYTSAADDNQNIWLDKLSDKSTKQIVFDDKGNYSPTASTDGKYIVYVSYRSGSQNLWRMNADGTQHTQLTRGSSETMPQITHDNKWVVYQTPNSLWKVPLSGGEPSNILPKNALSPVVSPDSKRLACFTLESSENAKWKIEIFSLEDMSLPSKVIYLPESTDVYSGLRWTPDGSGLTYVSEENGSSNILIHSLNDNSSKLLTEFKDQKIFSFAWSPDGKQVACSRGMRTYKALLFTPANAK